MIVKKITANHVRQQIITTSGLQVHKVDSFVENQNLKIKLKQSYIKNVINTHIIYNKML